MPYRLVLKDEHANIERRILMTLRFIYLKTGEPQNFEEQIRVAESFYLKMTEYIIRCWTFDVRCWTLNFLAFSAQHQLSANGVFPHQSGDNDVVCCWIKKFI
jgi:hypothetical protein